MLRQLLLLFLLAAVAAADWPQWRGAQRDGQIANFSAPAAWPDSLQLQWRTPVGRGDASPVVSGGHVFVHTRRDEEEYVSALDLAEGRLLWQDSYGDVPYQWATHHADERGKGPFATPALADGVLYTYGVTQVLSAYEAASGQLLWRHRLNQSLPFGTSASPIIVDGRVIVHLGDGKVGPLTAFDGRTGKTLWATQGRQGDYISLLSAAEVIFGLGNDATLSIIEPSATAWKTLAQYQVADSPTWAHPVVLGDQLLIKDATNLSLWTLSTGP